MWRPKCTMKTHMFVGYLCLLCVHHSLSVNDSSLLCGNEDASCQSQLGNSDADCRMTYFPTDDTECKEWIFKGSPDEQLGRVQLEPYVHTRNSFNCPVFKITFLRIKWNNLRFRFRLTKRNASKNVCREFHLAVEVAESRQLYFDCPWADPNDMYYKGMYYTFEYEARSGSGRREHREFLLQVPFFWPDEVANDTSVAGWPLFVYVEVAQVPFLTVRWAGAPRSLGGVEYDVTFHWNATSSGPEEVDFVGHVGADQELQLTYIAGIASATCRFGVRIIHTACGAAGCNVSFSPIINPGHSPNFIPTVVGCCALIVVLLCTFCALVKWLKRTQTAVKPPPTVLIVYIPTRRAHVKVVKEFAAYLRTYCGINVLLHDTHLPGQNVENLHTWFVNAYELAEFVMVVSSPFQQTDLREAIYVGAGEIGLQLLEMKLMERDMPPQNFISVVLPYCSKKDLPKVAACFKKFFLMRDLDKMLRHMQGERSGMLKMMDMLCKSELPGGSTQYKNCSGELASAIAKAATQVQNDVNIPAVVAPGEISITERADSMHRSQEQIPQVLEHLLDDHQELNRPMRSPYYRENLSAVARAESSQPRMVATKNRKLDASLNL